MSSVQVSEVAVGQRGGTVTSTVITILVLRFSRPLASKQYLLSLLSQHVETDLHVDGGPCTHFTDPKLNQTCPPEYKTVGM